MSDLELWGGHECTVNRVGDEFRDQTMLTGHHERDGDLELFASLGLKRLRYPVLWERTALYSSAQLDFQWADKRLKRLSELKIEPIVGLVHHGSGPRHTHLLDPDFALGVAWFARRVAERYPHVGDWTPINEPLTTARFSCLYGHWFPHVADERAFWIALLNQIDATRLSMAEIREVSPGARLIQTEDFGRTYATSVTQRQADYDNARRWMTWDLLCGKVGADHPLWERLCGFGLGDRLRAILDDPCPPDVLGLNHYLTSERFLDHRLERYPRLAHGGNGQVSYVDVEAVRVLNPAPLGLEGAMREVHARYERPLAITECHNGCTREEQMRWLGEAWRTAQKLRAEGAPVLAVTAWSLLGAYDWDSLLTRSDLSYETGVFDVSGGKPRATALAELARALALGGPHPAGADGPGWWRRDIRLEHPPAEAACRPTDLVSPALRKVSLSQPLLITGATGTLGRAFARACEMRGLNYVLTTRQMLDLGSDGSIEEALSRHKPWALINAAGWVNVDGAETSRQACFAANAEGVRRAAAACQSRGVEFIGFSTDLVFDGHKRTPYVESDQAAPLNVYGASKLAAERFALETGGALMIRTAAFFSPDDQFNFAAQLAEQLGKGQRFAAARDVVISPTYVPDLVRATLDLAIDRARGLWHLSNQGEVTWYEFARRLARACELPEDLISPVGSDSLGWTARRPIYAALGSQNGALLPGLNTAIGRFAVEMRQWAKHERMPHVYGV